MIGTVVLWIAFAAGSVSSYAYFRSATQRKPLTRLARNSFAAMAVTVLAASALLLLYVLRHQFEFAYVWGYSSRSLPLHLLITTIWAGQEGSFLFWALCGSIIGLMLMSYTRRKHIELEVMTIYALVQSFLLLLLLVKSPFQYIWYAHPGQFAVGDIPADGRGLNPLLQNIWMVVHPPVLFIGFAAMAVPFSFALAALWRKNYAEWISNAVPWVIFGALALGTGIMLGGYWAYGVLGWGGWWGWDPVENSSLIPWLVGVILIHTMLVQKRTGGLTRTNLILAISTYVLVVYSTFLTRSGILGESSVHSFVDPGALTYTLLVVWIVLSLVAGVGMLAKRWKELAALSQHSPFWSRESFLAISSAVIGASALVILFGTSWPILSHASLEPAFYDRTNLPIAIALGLLLGLSLLVQWRGGSPKDLAKSSAASLVISVVVLMLLVLLGLRDVWMAALAFASLFAFSVNVIRLYRLAKENYLYTGGAIAHIGLALLFLAIIGSGRYGQKETAALPLHEPKEVLGYKFTYTGSQATQDGKWRFTIRVEKDGSQFALEPVMFQSEYSNSLMRNPDYTSFLTKDIYIEPVSLEQSDPTGGAQAHDLLLLKKSEPQTIKDFQVTFLRFDMNHQGMEKMLGGNGVAIGAVLEIKRGKKTELVTPMTVYKEGQAPRSRIAKTKDGTIGFELLGMNVDAEKKGSTVEVTITGLQGSNDPPRQKSEALVIEASIKPFMGLVWVAAVLVIVGLLISLRSKLSARRDAMELGKSGSAGELTRRKQKNGKGEYVQQLSEDVERR